MFTLFVHEIEIVATFFKCFSNCNWQTIR